MNGALAATVRTRVAEECGMQMTSDFIDMVDSVHMLTDAMISHRPFTALEFTRSILAQWGDKAADEVALHGHVFLVTVRTALEVRGMEGAPDISVGMDRQPPNAMCAAGGGAPVDTGATCAVRPTSPAGAAPGGVGPSPAAAPSRVTHDPDPCAVGGREPGTHLQ